MSIPISVVLSVLSIVKECKEAGALLRDWLDDNRHVPLSVAIERTVRDYEGSFPAIRNALEEFLSSEQTKQELERLCHETRPDADSLVNLFIDQTDFYVESVERTVECAKEILDALMRHLNDALLTSDEGLRYHEQREMVRHEEILRGIGGAPEKTAELVLSEIPKAIVEGIRASGLHVADEPTVLTPVWKDRVERYKAVTKERGPRHALPLWRDLLREVQDKGTQDLKLLFDIHTNIGACCWEMRDEQSAKAHFIAAYNASPSEKRARLNFALAYMIDGDMKRAHDIVDEVLRQYPDDPKSLAVKAQLFCRDGRFRDALEVFEHYRGQDNRRTLDDSGCCTLLGCALRELGLKDAAVDVFQRGMELDPDDPYLKVQLAGVLAERVIELPGGLSPSAGEYDDLRRAEKLLSDAITCLQSREVTSALSEALADRAFIRLRLGLDRDAFEDASLAYRTCPFNPGVSKLYAILCLGTEKHEDGIAALEQCVKNTNDEEIVGLLIHACAARYRDSYRERVDSILQAHWPGHQMIGLPAAVLLSYAEVLVASGQFDRALAAADTLAAKGETSLAHIIRADTCVKRSDRPGALAELDKAWEASRKEDNWRAQIDIAYSYFDLQRWDKAAQVYEALSVGAWSPTFMVVRYLVSIFNSSLSSREDTALSIAEDFRKSRGLHPIVTQVEIAILEARREYERALILWDELTSMIPNRDSLKVGRARCLCLAGHRSRLKEALGELRFAKDLDDHHAMTLAELFYRVGEGETCLRFAYEAWRKGRHRAEINRAYIGLFLSVTKGDGPDLSAEVVQPGVAVTVESSGGKKTYVLVDDASMLIDEVHVRSETGSRLLGKRLGDTIEWRQEPLGPVEAVVVDIKHRYVWAFTTALETHRQAFPTDTSIMQVAVDPSLKALFMVIDHTYDHQKKVISEFRKHRLPFAVLPRALGKDIFGVWAAALSGRDFSLLFCTNTLKERARELDAIGTAQTLVLDPLALFTQQRLGTLDRLPGSFRRIVVPQHVYDALAECRRDLELMLTSEVSIGKTDEGYFRCETRTEDVERDMTFLDGILTFCEQHCERTGRPRQYTPFEQSTFSELVGDEFVVPLLVAQHLDGAVLYSDDAYLREFASVEYGVKGVSTWVVLEHQLQNGQLSDEEYSRLMIGLLKSNYKRVPIGHHFLRMLACSSMNPSAEDFSIAMDELFSEGTEPDSAVSVLVGFCRDLVARVTFTDAATPFVLLALGRILEHCGPPGVRRFHQGVKRQGIIEVPAIKTLAGIVEAWMRARGIA